MISTTANFWDDLPTFDENRTISKNARCDENTSD
jgi:hypothetical protein